MTTEELAAVEAKRYSNQAWLKSWARFDECRGKTVLEVGCGMGTDALQFARAGARYHAVDLTPRSLEITRTRLAWEGFTGELVHGDVENLPYPDNTFDVVYSMGVLHHVPNTERAIAECRRVLKPGGEAVIAVYHRRSLFYWTFLFLYHGVLRCGLRRYTMAQIAALNVESGASDPNLKVACYTKAEVQQMFAGFSRVRLEIRHLTENDVFLVSNVLRHLPWLRPAVCGLLRVMEPLWGWYVCVRAVK